MTNPYAGVSSYNRALDHAAHVVANVVDKHAKEDSRLLEIGYEAVRAIVRLQRQPRKRRRSWRTPVLHEVTVE